MPVDGDQPDENEQHRLGRPGHPENDHPGVRPGDGDEDRGVVEAAQDATIAREQPGQVVDAADREHGDDADAVDDRRGAGVSGRSADRQQDREADRHRHRRRDASHRAAQAAAARSSLSIIVDAVIVHLLVRRCRRWRAVTPGPGSEACRPGQRLATFYRLSTAARLVAGRRFEVEVPLLDRRQPIVAHAPLGQRRQLVRQVDGAGSALRREARRD